MSDNQKTWTYSAKITHVHDGDTVTAAINVWPDMVITRKIRLSGIDAPEIEGPQKPQGLKATEWLKEKVEGKEVRLVVHGFGDFGRLLADIWLDKYQTHGSLNEWMATLGLAETWAQHEKEQRDGTEDAI